jgi:2-dehydro-3-deoxyphosphogalactonate aldolase
LKITSIEAIAVDVPEEAKAGSLWLFVKLLTNKKGLVGYGEVYTLGVPFAPATLQTMVKDFGGHLAVGADPYQIESLFQNGYDYGYSHYPEFTRMGIVSAIEMACWDIVGKDLARPVYDLLGGSIRDKIRTYSYLSSTTTTPSSVPLWRDAHASAEAAKQFMSDGFTAVKIDPVLGRSTSRAIAEYEMVYPTEETLEALDLAQDVVGAIRKAVGNKCDILIGTHGQFTAAGAIRFAKRLEQFDPLWLEEPVPPDNIEEMAVVARGTTIPICAGERLATKFNFATLIENKAAAIINFDVGRVGGILEARKIAAMAEAHYVQVAPHVYGGPLIAAASFQIDVCCPNFLIQECIGKFSGLHAELLNEPIEWKNGFVIPSKRPGLGYELNEAAAKKYAF